MGNPYRKAILFIFESSLVHIILIKVFSAFCFKSSNNNTYRLLMSGWPIYYMQATKPFEANYGLLLN